jgi:hypothetical protein
MVALKSDTLRNIEPIRIAPTSLLSRDLIMLATILLISFVANHLISFASNSANHTNPSNFPGQSNEEHPA